jgi:hypothetical protein
MRFEWCVVADDDIQVTVAIEIDEITAIRLVRGRTEIECRWEPTAPISQRDAIDRRVSGRRRKRLVRCSMFASIHGMANIA